MILEELDLEKARRMSWDFARTYNHEKELGASPNPMILWASNTINDLCNEVEMLRKLHVSPIPSLVFVPKSMGP